MKKTFKNPFSAPKVVNKGQLPSDSKGEENSKLNDVPRQTISSQPNEEDKDKNVELNPTLEKCNNKKAMPVRTMTDEEYEELFAAVLLRMNTEDAGNDDFETVANAVIDQKIEVKASKDVPVKQTKPRVKPLSKSHNAVKKEETKPLPSKPLQINSVQVSRSEAKRKPSTDEKKTLQKGTWIQCSQSYCNKWRHLSDLDDPARLPEDWVCEMNTDEKYNDCDKPEETWDAETHDKGFIYLCYTEGSLVWAKMSGYPWWPAVIESDPDYETFYECENDENKASHYHVVFLDDKTSRLWLRDRDILPFNGENNIKERSTATERQRYKRSIAKARQMAVEALELPMQERLNKYGFIANYKAQRGKTRSKKEKNLLSPDIHKNGEDLMDFDLEAKDMGHVMSEADALLRSTEAILDEYFSSQSQKETDDCESYQPPSPKKIRKPKFCENRKLDATSETIKTPAFEELSKETTENEIKETDTSDSLPHKKLKTNASKTEDRDLVKPELKKDPEVFTMEMADSQKENEIRSDHASHTSTDAKRKERSVLGSITVDKGALSPNRENSKAPKPKKPRAAKKKKDFAVPCANKVSSATTDRDDDSTINTAAKQEQTYEEYLSENVDLNISVDEKPLNQSQNSYKMAPSILSADSEPFEE